MDWCWDESLGNCCILVSLTLIIFLFLFHFLSFPSFPSLPLSPPSSLPPLSRPLQGPVTFRVHVPNLSERPEWKMNGQLITMTLPITDPVRSLSLSHSISISLSLTLSLSLQVFYVRHTNTFRLPSYTDIVILYTQLLVLHKLETCS